MRIKKIKVNGLFDIFNHEINLDLNDRITLIHGPNGYGKTTILRMIDALFNKKFSVLRKVKFANFSVYFENGTTLNIKNLGKVRSLALVFEHYIDNKKVDTFTSHSLENTHGEFSMLLGRIERRLPKLKRISMDRWYDEVTGEVQCLEEVIEENIELLSGNINDSLTRNNEYQQLNIEDLSKEWLDKIIKETYIKFIKENRLLQYSNEANGEFGYKKNVTTISTVERYSKELSSLIEAKLAEYATLSQSLDRTFPVRVVKLGKGLAFSDEQFKMNLQRLEEKRNKFIEVGLLNKEADGEIQIPDQIDSETVSVLSVYIGDVEEKLSVLDEIANKINVFKTLLESRFMYKKMSIKKGEGFVFTARDGRELSSNDLSSGEQHEIVMLYELLFKTNKGALVLIDEPELSLHVSWQVNFLKDIQEIINVGNFDLLIATHSPQIINDRWDLTVELKGNQ